MVNFEREYQSLPQRWFLTTESLSQIFISKILISEVVYENWRVLAVICEINATLSPFCTLRFGLRKWKNQRNLHWETTCRDLSVDGHALNSLCTFKSTVTRSYKRLTLPDLNLLLLTTLSNGGFRVQWTPLLTHEPFALTASNLVGRQVYSSRSLNW